jgi:peptidoglycan/xylan/chitin deacetylase (PgdA/CDA1 family)
VTQVALTFDTEFPGRPARPGGEDRILDTLAGEEVRGSFFLQGRWTRANPEIAQRIAAAGHLIGNHSNFHAPMNGLSDEWFRRDVERAELTIRETTGVDPKPWFRCPFGRGMDEARVLNALEALGYRHVGWDVDPRDWDETRTVDELVKFVVAGEGIVLLHAWPTITADGLGLVIDGLRERGAELVGVDELV